MPTFPAPVVRLTPVGDGRIVGTGGSYMGNFLYDPKTSTVRHLGVIGLSENSGIACQGKVYLSGYPSGALFEYDPDKAWTTNRATKPWEKRITETDKRANPRRLLYLRHAGSGCHVMFAAALGADGCVYFGGAWYRDGNAGGLGWYNPKTGKSGGFYKPLINYQVKYMTSTGNGRYIVLSTRAVRGDVDKSPQPKAAKLFVFDTRTKKLIGNFTPVEKSLFIGPIVGATDNCILGLTYNPTERNGVDKQKNVDGQYDQSAILYKANAATGKVLWRRILPFPVGFRTNENARGKDGFAFITGPDGWIWTYTGGRMVHFNPDKPWHITYQGKYLALVRINPDNGETDVVGKIDRPSALAFSGNDLVLAGGDRYCVGKNTTVRRLKNICTPIARRLQ